MTDREWHVSVAASAERQLQRLPEKVAVAVVEFVVGPLCENPYRVGHPLQRELFGLWSARRGAYRVMYEISEETATVVVLRVDHRFDVYRQR